MDERADRDDSVRPGPELPDEPDAAGWGVWTRRELPPERTAADDAQADGPTGERPAPRPAAPATGDQPTRRKRPARPPSEPPRIRFVWGDDEAEVADREASTAAVDEVHFAGDDPDATVVSRRSSTADVDTAQPQPRRD